MSMVSQAAKVNTSNWIAVNEICYRSPFTLDVLTTTARNRRRQRFRRSKRDATVITWLLPYSKRARLF